MKAKIHTIRQITDSQTPPPCPNKTVYLYLSLLLQITIIRSYTFKKTLIFPCIRTVKCRVSTHSIISPSDIVQILPSSKKTLYYPLTSVFVPEEVIDNEEVALKLHSSQISDPFQVQIVGIRMQKSLKKLNPMKFMP